MFIEACMIMKIQYSQRHNAIVHCDRRITLLSDTDIFWSVQSIYLF